MQTTMKNRVHRADLEGTFAGIAVLRRFKIGFDVQVFQLRGKSKIRRSFLLRSQSFLLRVA